MLDLHEGILTEFAERQANAWAEMAKVQAKFLAKRADMFDSRNYLRDLRARDKRAKAVRRTDAPRAHRGQRANITDLERGLIRSLVKRGVSYREIERRTGVGRMTIAKVCNA